MLAVQSAQPKYASGHPADEMLLPFNKWSECGAANKYFTFVIDADNGGAKDRCITGALSVVR